MTPKQDQEREILSSAANKTRYENGEYVDPEVQSYWEVWRARAALAQQAEPPELSPELEQQAEPVRVPVVDPLQGAVDWFWSAIPDLQTPDVASRLSIGYNRASRLLTAAQAAQPEPQRVMFNGLTEAETLATASVAGLTEPQRVGAERGSNMTRAELLQLMRLLSALESWSFSVGKAMPDYLHEDICKMVTRLEEEILNEATKEPGNG